MSAARTGDEAAWNALYGLHAGRLVLWLRWLPSVDPAASSEDIAAQAWLTAATRLDRFRGSDDDFGGWLFGIARRHAANHCRRGIRRRTRTRDVESSEESVFSEAHDELGRVDELDNIRRLLAELSPREAEVVACRDVVGLDVRSTAVALRMNPTAVRVAHHRALTRLRRLLYPQGRPVQVRPDLGETLR